MGPLNKNILLFFTSELTKFKISHIAVTEYTLCRIDGREEGILYLINKDVCINEGKIVFLICFKHATTVFFFTENDL